MRVTKQHKESSGSCMLSSDPNHSRYYRIVNVITDDYGRIELRLCNKCCNKLGTISKQ